ncbi:hypothetical protein DL89DRAFT_174134 [Linderina pennispora]|uniref:Ima1 N-terminal domain-containing protein n=1 Tax=Linderina pennispora TaxID=61395 RepID=A0A1Y1W6X4_9FUNG|nr:uncharacterized protein DL89DRAFT_174134 [Linderina pennispora]ORX69271.1 hypothetical protein DL89DRAFT_174134 [Linderina pennispora]
MWSFLGDRQARVTCWCCNETTRLPRSEADSDTVHDWHCDNCDTQNTVNKEGEIVDSRDEMYREVPGSSQRKLRILSGIESPSSSFPVVVFCKTCQSNQNRVYQLLSEYLPEETDSHYAQRLAEADAYSRTLRRRYPVACKQCQEKVDDLLQSQASWLRKKELASSLRQSERVRKYEPNIRPKPTLRRKGVTMAWLVFALLGFIACPLAALGLYIDTQHGYLDPPWQVLVAGAAISMATFLSGLLNPLWLRAAFSTSIRIAGLPRYRRRIQFLSAGRLAVAVGFFCRRPSRDLAIGLGIVDTCMFVYAFWALEIVSKLRTRSLSRHTSDSDDTGDEATDEATAKTADSDTPLERARKTDEATSSMGELSLGESVVNRDQNDSLRGTAFASLHGDHRSGDRVSQGRSMAHLDSYREQRWQRCRRRTRLHVWPGVAGCGESARDVYQRRWWLLRVWM